MADENNKNTAASGNGEGMSMEDIFNQLGDVFSNWKAPKSARRGKDLRLKLMLTEQEMAAGVTKTVRFLRNVVCPVCGGSGATDSDSMVNCSDCGGTGKVEVAQENAIFGTNKMKKECPTCKGTGKFIFNLCFDCEGSGVTRDEVTETIQVPAGIAVGSCLSIKGRGNAGINGGEAGDLFVVIELKK